MVSTSLLPDHRSQNHIKPAQQQLQQSGFICERQNPGPAKTKHAFPQSFTRVEQCQESSTRAELRFSTGGLQSQKWVAQLF